VSENIHSPPAEGNVYPKIPPADLCVDTGMRPLVAPNLSAALAYARVHGWPVFPCNWRSDSSKFKTPLTGNGFKNASKDPAIITEWWTEWPQALIGLPTGASIGVVVLDIDRKNGVDGLDCLEGNGWDIPETPIVHTASGGLHYYFAHPGHLVPCSAGKIGPGIDIRGDGGYVIAPHAKDSPWHWDAHCRLSNTPLEPMPWWLVEWLEHQNRKIQPVNTPRPATSSTDGLSRYGERALDEALKRITEAPCGSQEPTLNREAFSIGQLVADDQIPAGLAREALIWAAQRMPSYNPRWPWQPYDLQKKVEKAFSAGLNHPRAPKAHTALKERRHG